MPNPQTANPNRISSRFQTATDGGPAAIADDEAKRRRRLEFGDWSLSGVWSLGFVVSARRIAIGCALLSLDAAEVDAASAPSQQRYTVRVWETEDGLPNNSVGAMVQTRDGYLWLGTLNGLARFDGRRFQVFDQNNTPGLPDNRISCLFEDSQRNLWIGTESSGTAIMNDGRVTAPSELWDPLESTCRHASLSIL